MHGGVAGGMCLCSILAGGLLQLLFYLVSHRYLGGGLSHHCVKFAALDTFYIHILEYFSIFAVVSLSFK